MSRERRQAIALVVALFLVMWLASAFSTWLTGVPG